MHNRSFPFDLMVLLNTRRTLSSQLLGAGGGGPSTTTTKSHKISALAQNVNQAGVSSHSCHTGYGGVRQKVASSRTAQSISKIQSHKRPRRGLRG